MALEYVTITMVDFMEMQALAGRLPDCYERQRLLTLLEAYDPHRPQPEAMLVFGDPKLTRFTFEEHDYIIPTAQGKRICATERGVILLPDGRLVYPDVFAAPIDAEIFSIVSVKLYTGSDDEKDLNPQLQVRAGLRTKPS